MAEEKTPVAEDRDNLCPECDSSGMDENGHLCKACQGKGYVNP